MSKDDQETSSPLSDVTTPESQESTQKATQKATEASVPPMKFGDWLKSRRLAKKVSLEEIAAVTKVHLSQLKALEDGDLAKLPATAFVRGFIISYARHLDLDENEALSRFKEQHSDGASITDLLVPETNKLARSQSFPKVRIVTSPHYKTTAAVSPELDAKPKSYAKPRFWLISLSVTAVCLTIVGLIWLGRTSSQNPSREESTPQSSASTEVPQPAKDTKAAAVATVPPTTPAAAPAPTKSVTPTPSTAAVSASSVGPALGQSIELRPIEDSFVNVRIDDGVAQGVHLKAGIPQPFSYNSRITFAFSNAGAVEIRKDGVVYGAPGARGDVKRLSLPEQIGTLVPRPTVRSVPRPAAAIAPAPTAPLGTSTLDPAPSTDAE